MACGCSGSCNCTLAAGPGISISQGGGADFTISAIQFISSVLDGCIDLTVVDGVLSATPVLADTDSVDLTCDVDGISADVILDPSSTADVSITASGLKIDVPEAPALPDSVFPATIRTYDGVRNPVGWLDADGSAKARTDYPELFDALSLMGSTATRTAGSPTVTGIDTTRFAAAGMPAEVTGFAFGTTVVSIDAVDTITFSTNAVGTSAGDVEVRIFPHGNGDGASTFDLPNHSRRVSVGFDYDGTIGTYQSILGNFAGTDAVTLGVADLPSHAHPGSVLDSTAATTNLSGGGSVSTDPDGAHYHTAGSAGNPASDFVTVENAAIAFRGLAPVTAGSIPFTTPPATGAGVTDAISIPTFAASSGIITAQQGTRAATNTQSAHDHAVDGAAIAALLGASTVLNDSGVTVAPQGGGGSHENMQQSIVSRKIIKT